MLRSPMVAAPAPTVYPLPHLTNTLCEPNPVWWILFSSPVILVLVLVALQTSGSRTPGIVTAGGIAVFLLAMAYAFRALELTIDDHALTVGFPVYHDRVPLDQIVACRPIRYRWWEFGGYGIRWGRRGTMFNVGGDG